MPPGPSLAAVLGAGERLLTTIAVLGNDDHDLVRLLHLERGRVTLVEMRLPQDSPNAGRPLYELRLPQDAAIVAIIREGHVVIPQLESVLAAGDEIIALSSPEAEESLRLAVVGGPGHGIAASAG